MPTTSFKKFDSDLFDEFSKHMDNLWQNDLKMGLAPEALQTLEPGEHWKYIYKNLVSIKLELKKNTNF